MCTDLRFKPPVATAAPGSGGRDIGRRNLRVGRVLHQIHDLFPSIHRHAPPPGNSHSLLALALVASAAPAEAAKRKVPFGFFGAVLNNGQANRLSDAGLDAQMAAMARNGVESVRYTFAWSTAEPARGRYNFASYDRVVAAAARHRIGVLPIVVGTPRWASSRPLSPRPYLYAPKSSGTYAAFLRTLVRRYGPRGSFWRISGTPKVSIRSWQLWNEPAADFFWATRPWPRSYARILKPAYRAVKRADRGATVVLASLAGVTNSTPWAQLRALYRAGARKYFNAVSLHFFSSSPRVRLTVRQTLEIASRIRREMRRARDRRKPIWFTELTWTAAEGTDPKGAICWASRPPRGDRRRA